jgi:hypothetical protein
MPRRVSWLDPADNRAVRPLRASSALPGSGTQLELAGFWAMVTGLARAGRRFGWWPILLFRSPNRLTVQSHF